MPSKTSLRIDLDVDASRQVDTLHRAVHFADEMRAAGWIVELYGHLTVELSRPAVSTPQPPKAEPEVVKSRG